MRKSGMIATGNGDNAHHTHTMRVTDKADVQDYTTRALADRRTHTCTRTDTYTHIHACTCAHTHTHSYAHVPHLHTHNCTHTHTHTHIHTHTHTHTHKHTHTQPTNTRTSCSATSDMAACSPCWSTGIPAPGGHTKAAPTNMCVRSHARLLLHFTPTT
jgi:hypothetical protein